MKKMIFLKNFIAVVIFSASMFSVNAQDRYWTDVRNDFNQRTDISQDVRQKIFDFSAKSDKKSRDLSQYLTFLYAYMPQSDLADYDFSFFEKQVAVACEARETFDWGKSIPDDIFRHFVVVYRVNNENLDTARSYIFHQLKDRIKKMNMYDAALEVNHWCHEYVDYQPADARTSAPLATMRTSHGRCGEESTLTVTALRAVGIPARQCYTPRWAHCDDNHAWVEVWVDGKWYFLGACEPAPALNMGWFDKVSTRTMMVHTNVFGKYEGPEEVNKQTPFYSCINLLSNYADTITANVIVYDTKHKPAKNATVCFKLYNYSEYYTLAEVKTDQNGRAKLNTGRGDLLIWAKQDDNFAFGKIDLREQNNIVLILKKSSDYNENDNISFVMNPPIGKPLSGDVSASAIAACEKKMAKEDAKREAYRATFPTIKETAKFYNENFSQSEFYDIIKRSEGNYAEIIDFLQKHDKKIDGIYLKEFVTALADKDLRDTKAETLESQLVKFESGKYPLDVFFKGILPARISNELIRDWRAELKNLLTKEIGKNNITASELTNWTKKNIKIDEQCNYYNCPISPCGVYKTRRADLHSLKIFFVAACRSLDIPAYEDNASSCVYFWQNGDWQEVTFENKDNSEIQKTALLTLHNPENYTYYVHYTLQRFENGEYVSYDFEGDKRVESQNITLTLPAGKYCLSTGNRYSDGEVLSNLQFFELKAGEEKELTIKIPVLVPRNNNYGVLNMSENTINGTTLAQILQKSGKEKMILCLVNPGTEPTNHLAKEIAARGKDYETWNGKIIFLASNQNWKKEKNQPSNLEIITKKHEKISENIKSALENAVHDGVLSHYNGERPVCLVLDKSGNILFFSEGYHIGLGNFLLENVK